MKDCKYFCYEIFKNLAIRSQNGTVEYMPCSYFTDIMHQSNAVDINAAWNSDGRKKVIELIQENKPVAGCAQCYRDEEQGTLSRRQSAAELYEKYHSDTIIALDGPQGLDYSVGNLCNLKCIICGPLSSTSWIPDYQQMRPGEDLTKFQFLKNNQLELTNDASLANLKSVHIHGGGEPFLSDSHVRLLKRIDAVKGLSDVRVFYNTNGTQTVTDEVLDLWSRCKLIELYFSIDDINERFNYQRTGADFVQVTRNLQWFYENMPNNHMFKVNAVWSYLNLFYLDELVDWHANNFSVSRVGDPIDLILQRVSGRTCITHINEHTNEILTKKFNNYPQLTALLQSLSISSADHSEFLNWISKLDNIRGHCFNDVAPEWSKLLYDSVYR